MSDRIFFMTRELPTMQETVYEHIKGSDTVTITAAEKWSVTMIKRLYSKYPDEVEICCENLDGSVVAHVPLDWMQIKPKRKVSPRNVENLKGSRNGGENESILNV